MSMEIFAKQHLLSCNVETLITPVIVCMYLGAATPKSKLN